MRGVVVVEPKLPRRSRRPSDLARLVGSLLLLAIPLVLGSVAVSTSTGLEQDLLRSFDAIQGLTKLVLRLGVVRRRRSCCSRSRSGWASTCSCAAGPGSCWTP